MTKLKVIGLLVVVLLGGWLALPAAGQDLNTLLVYFIKDMRDGTWGTSTPASKVTITDDAIATTSTDGVVVTNTTAATSGATVQMSPRVRWRGNAWDTAASQTVDFFAENLPVSAATPTGIWKLGYSLNGAAASYPLTLTSAGVLTTLNNIASGGGVIAADGSSFYWVTRSQIYSAADGAIRLSNNAGTDFTRLQFGGTTTSFPALTRSATALSLTTGDGTLGAILGHGKQAVVVDGATTLAITSDYISLACTGAETINTITGGVTGTRLVIEHTDTDCTIADDDDATAANAIDLTGTATNDTGAVKKVLTLLYNGTDWMELYESDN